MPRIRTYTNPIRRWAGDFWQACEDHPLLPLAIVIVLLGIVNSPLLN